MKIVFLGQAAFGKDALEVLLSQGEKIVGVLTTPDAPGPKANPVKQCAVENNLPVIQPVRLRDPEVIEWVRALQPDLLVLAFVTSFVPKEMIDLATYGGINYHPSLLPKYRGGSAINWALIHGETETGVTIHFIDEGVDTGDILLQEKVSVDPEDTVKSVYFNKLYPLGLSLISRAVSLIKEGKATRVPQDHSQASFQPVIKEKDVQIDWSCPASQIYNLIRGSNPTPGAFTFYQGRKLTIWEARRSGELPGNRQPGEICEISADGLLVATADGGVLAQKVQYEGQVKMPAQAFADQQLMAVGVRLGA